MQITISNAVIKGEDGVVTKATITGDAKIVPQSGEPVDPSYGIDVDEGYVRPSHPILLPPPSTGNSFWMLCYCPNPPPAHWEWISFSPGSPPERPTPTPPTPPIGTTPPGIKPPPPQGGWGFFPGYGWVYYPGPGGAGPKR